MSKQVILKPIYTFGNKIVLQDLNVIQYKVPNTDCYNISEAAIKQNKNVVLCYTKDNLIESRKTGYDITVGNDFPELIQLNDDLNVVSSEVVLQDNSIKSNIPEIDIRQFIHTSIKLKPVDFIISESKWKYLIRNVLKGKNILITGPSGCGKTMALLHASTVFSSRPTFFIPLGSTQDPRTALIGNTHFNKDTGTVFNKSYFVKAIETPNAIIILDEISRAHPDAGNILMSVLDYKLRFLRLDEEFDTPTINVASGVCFMSTANVGSEYTYTRKLDRALLDRFTILEMDMLNKDQELKLLTLKFPDVNKLTLDHIADIANNTRLEIVKPDSKIQTFISTRSSLEIAELISDGFSLSEAADVHIYPLFSNQGGDISERTFIRQSIQQYLTNVENAF